MTFEEVQSLYFILKELKNWQNVMNYVGNPDFRFTMVYVELAMMKCLRFSGLAREVQLNDCKHIKIVEM